MAFDGVPQPGRMTDRECTSEIQRLVIARQILGKK
jgi:hypothetical protein